MRWPVTLALLGLVAGVGAQLRSGDVSTAARRYGARAPTVAQPVPLATTTTTTLGATAPNWTPSMVAVWLLEEGGAGASRVDATGHGHTLDNLLGTPGRDTVLKMQGTAAMLVDGTTGARRGPDNALAAPTPPFSVGCWVRPTDTSSGGENQGIVGSYDFAVGGYFLSWVDAANGYRAQACKASASCLVAGVAGTGADNTFSHVVGNIWPDRLQLFVNGTQRDTDQMGTNYWTPDTGDWFFVGNNPQDARTFKGQIDECFLYVGTLSPASTCRICSCGVDGALCTCTGTVFTSSGRDASACGSCSLPACNAATP